MWLELGSLFVIFTLGASDGGIIFPEDQSPEGVLSGNEQKLTERVPINSPTQCPRNELLYPGDGNKSAWVCDCYVGYLYFPRNDSCHEAYRQGPCLPQHYVVLPPGEAVAKCERNPCLEDGLVPYNNTCSRVNSVGGPCHTGTSLIVNSTTYQLECASTFIDPLHIIDAPANRCPNGSRRNALGQCRIIL